MSGLERGYVQIYTGGGKGKTTAALGLCARALGADLDVRMFQFMKKLQCSEHEFAERVGLPVKQVEPGDLKTMNRALFEEALSSYQGGVDVLVLDEVGEALRRGFLTREDIERAVAEKPVTVELIMTGRGLGETIGDLADLITEMQPIKHYFDEGVMARKGIEY